MAYSVTEIGRAVRRRLERVVQKSRDKDYARRALAILHLWETDGNVAQAAQRVRAARSFTTEDIRTLIELEFPQGRHRETSGVITSGIAVSLLLAVYLPAAALGS